MANPAAIRLGTVGKAQVKADFAEVSTAGKSSFASLGDAGEAAAKRFSRAMENADRDVEAAMVRRERAQAKLAAILPQSPIQMRVDSAAGTGFGQWEGSARQSAAAFIELEATQRRLEERARALVQAMDPVAAAQDRFNREMSEARGLVSAGVLSLDEYSAKLRHERDALDVVSAAHGRSATMSGQHRAALQNVGFQLQDFFVQVSSGQSVMTAFIQQFPQAAGAVSGMGGKMAGVAAFMGGPWGIGLTVAAAALLPLVGKLFETEKSTDDLVKKLKEDAVETAKAAAAKDIYAKSLDGVIEKQKALNAELARERMTQQQVAQGRLDDSRASLTQEATAVFKALDDVTAARRRVEQTRKAAEAASATATDESGSAQTAYAAAVRDLQAKTRRYQDLTKAATETQRAVRDAEMAISERQVIASMDAGTAAVERYDAALGQLRKRRSEGKISDAEFRAAIERERKTLKAAEDAARAAGRTTRDPETATPDSIRKMLRAALPGVQITATTNGKHVPNSYHYRGQAVDFVPRGGMGSMTKADVRKLFESRGIEIAELLGPGDKNHSDHFHVAWKKGKLALEEFSDAARRAQADAATLEALTGKYDPLAAAADRYRKTLAEIDRLKPANADALRAGARAEFQQARATDLGKRIGLDGITAGADEEQKVIDKLAEDAKRAADASAEQAKRRAEAVADMIAGQQESILLARTELGLVAANDATQQAALGKVRLILDLKRMGVAVDSDEGRQILANAASLDAVTEQLARQREAWETIRGIGGDLVNTVLSPSTWSDWGEGGKRVLGMLKDEFVKLALLNPIRNLLFGENGATLTSLFGGLGRLFGGAGAAIPAGGSQGFTGPPLATGTEWWSGGMALVGEHGREIVSMPRGSRVTSAPETRRLLSGQSQGRMRVEVVPSQYFDVRVQEATSPLVSDGMSRAATYGAAGGAQIAAADARASAGRRLGRRW